MTGLFSQRDERWANIPLGVGGGHTLASAGCLVTCLAGMLADTLVDIDPGRLNRWLCRHDGFTGGNRVVFGALASFDLQYELIDCSASPAPVARIAEALGAGERYGVLVEVDHAPGGARQQHWVRLLSVAGDGEDSDYLMHDPWLPPGTLPYSLLARYALPHWDAARAIYRVVVYRMADMQHVFTLPGYSAAAQGYVCVRGV